MIYIGLLVIVTILGAFAIITRLATVGTKPCEPAFGRLVEVAGGRLGLIDLQPPRPDARFPLVLLHGASSDAEGLRVAFGDRFAVDRRVILIDRPGHGRSDRPDGAGDASPVRQAELIREALDRIGVMRFILLGYSLGGTVATAFALAYPERIAGLILVAPVTNPCGGGLSWYIRLMSTPVAGPLLAYTVVVPLRYLRHGIVQHLVRPSQLVADAEDVAALNDFVAGQAPFYKNIKTPTVIITGSADTAVLPDIHARAIAAVLPNARLVVLDGIGHLLQPATCGAVAAAIESLPMWPPVPMDAAG